MTSGYVYNIITFTTELDKYTVKALHELGITSECSLYQYIVEAFHARLAKDLLADRYNKKRDIQLKWHHGNE